MSRRGGFTLIIVLIILGKASGFLKDLFITYYHGVSVVTDAYFLSSSIASVVYMGIYASIPSLIVPMYSRLQATGNAAQLDRRLSAGLFFFALISAAIGLFVALSSEQIVRLFSGGPQDEVTRKAAHYLSITALSFTLSSIVSFFNAIQTVNGITNPSYAVPITNNCAFCLGLYLFSDGSEFGRVVALGVAAWFALVLLNGWISKSSFRISISSAFDLFHDKKFLLLLYPSMLVFYVEQLNVYIGIYFASMLDTGAISVLGYSTKLNMVFLSIFLVFLTASLFPKISTLKNFGGEQALRKFVTGCLRYLLIASIPIAIYMSIHSKEIVALLFQRGKFDADDVGNVAKIFAWAVLALPFSLIRDFMNRVFFSHEDTTTPAVISTLALLVNFVVCYYTYKHLGLLAIVVGVLTAAIVTSMLSLLMAQRRMKIRLLGTFIRTLLLCVVAGVCASIAVEYMQKFMLLYWIVFVVPFFLIYCVILLIAGVEEMWTVVSKTARAVGFSARR